MARDPLCPDEQHGDATGVWPFICPWCLLREAHAEIRRLQAQVETARSVAAHACQVCAICQGEIVDVPIIGEAT